MLEGMTLTETDLDPRTAAPLPASLRLGAVHLTVADRARSVAWYEQSICLRVYRHGDVDAEQG